MKNKRLPAGVTAGAVAVLLSAISFLSASAQSGDSATTQSRNGAAPAKESQVQSTAVKQTVGQTKPVWHSTIKGAALPAKTATKQVKPRAPVGTTAAAGFLTGTDMFASGVEVTVRKSSRPMGKSKKPR